MLGPLTDADCMGREEIAQERLRGLGEKYMCADLSLRGLRMLKKAVQQGRRRSKNRRRTLLGYVEDSCELRTPLADFFSILLRV